MATGRDWRAWYLAYEDPSSSLSARLGEVRGQLTSLLAQAPGPLRLLGLCSGDGRDTLPVLTTASVEVSAVLVELDPGLADDAHAATVALGLDHVEVRTADAGTTECARGGVPADIVMACGIFGNVTDDDIARTVATLPSLLAPGGAVVWTRGRRTPGDPTTQADDPADFTRRLFVDAGFEEVTYVRPTDASYRVGVHRWPGPAAPYEPGVRMFTFV